MEGAEPLPKRSLSVLPKLTTALLLETKRAQHPKNTQKRLFRQGYIFTGLFDKLRFLPILKERTAGGKNGHPTDRMPAFPGNIYRGDVIRFQYGRPDPPGYTRPLPGHRIPYRCLRNSYTGQPGSGRSALRCRCRRRWHSRNPRNHPAF